jgi:hypothetical protein
VVIDDKDAGHGEALGAGSLAVETSRAAASTRALRAARRLLCTSRTPQHGRRCDMVPEDSTPTRVVPLTGPVDAGPALTRRGDLDDKDAAGAPLGPALPEEAHVRPGSPLSDPTRELQLEFEEQQEEGGILP